MFGSYEYRCSGCLTENNHSKYKESKSRDSKKTVHKVYKIGLYMVILYPFSNQTSILKGNKRLELNYILDIDFISANASNKLDMIYVFQ